MSDNETIRVLIVDDHAVVRSGLRKVLESEPDIEVVGEAGDAQNAVFQTRETKPDVILMDVVMPGKTGIEAIPEVLHDAPEAKVLILSMQDDPHYVREAFAAGAAGYVLKEAVDTDVVAAIRDVAAGRRYVHPALGARMLVADAEERKRAEEDPALRPRARRPSPPRSWAHEPRDRKPALHLGAHSRNPPGAHHAEAAPAEPCGARPLRARSGPARGRRRLRLAGGKGEGGREVGSWCLRFGSSFEGHQVFARTPSSGRLHTHARVDRDAAVRERKHRVEVELGDGRDVLAETGEPQEQVGERRAVCGRGAAEPATSRPALPP